MTARLTQKQKLLNLLQERYDGVTSTQAQKRGINRVSSRLHELRQDGYNIYTNYRTDKKLGRKVYSYRLDNVHR